MAAACYFGLLQVVNILGVYLEYKIVIKKNLILQPFKISNDILR